ncbi:MAG: VWA domain-containing protein [Promethearchaeota archaeon]|nr:MAG: VWA domain-containing protein [Candidatus Lokiarchaeota archaeon]
MIQSRRKKGRNFKQGASEKEKKIIELAKIAWNKTLKEFYYPPLNEPNYVFDYTHLEGFYIDPDHRWQITMNLANTPILKDDQEYIDYFYIISLHEVSHYQIIPYDGLINAKLLRSAMEYVNQNYAPIVVNIFADLIIDTKLFKKYTDLIIWEMCETYKHLNSKGPMSNFSKFLFRAYEKMWNKDVIGDETLKEMDSLAGKVSKIILKDFEDESTWEKKVSQIANNLNILIQDTFTLIGTRGILDRNKEKRKSPGGAFVEVPKDVLEIMDNPLENKNSDKLKEGNDDSLQQKSEEFAKNIPYSEFGGPARQAGILVDGSTLAAWYRGLAKNLIEIKIFEQKPGGQLPIYPELWRIGDRIEELDIVQSLLNSPVIIPNITTRKWAFTAGPGHLIEQEIPDLLIVLDSSGSMGWNYTSRSISGRGPYHTALVAAFASLHYAASKGAKFSIINFSNRADICQWTSNYKKAEKTLLRYQGGGTFLPIEEITNQCEKAEKKALVFIITDFGIYNWSKAKKAMLNLVEKGHKIVGFFIGSKKIPKDKFKSLFDRVTFYGIGNPKDLISLVIKEVQNYYV